MIKDKVHQLLTQQINEWKLAADNYQALKQVKVKSFDLNGYTYKVQFNPARIASSAAKIDDKSIQERKCFLCQQNLPADQKGIPFKDHYSILVNPFPIFPYHLTIPDKVHTDQYIFNRMEDMLDLAKELDDFIIFYNGPKAGASAPDHFHFQAGNKSFLPFEREWKYKNLNKIATYKKATIGYVDETYRATLLIESESKEDLISLFQTVYGSMELRTGEKEPMMNILTWYEGNRYIVCIFPREKHRPACYFAEGEENLLISPGSVDMGGVFITPLEKDFNKITATHIDEILKEVSISPAKFHILRQQIKERL